MTAPLKALGTVDGADNRLSNAAPDHTGTLPPGAVVPAAEPIPPELERVVAYHADRETAKAGKVLAASDRVTDEVAAAPEALRELVNVFREQERTAQQKRGVTLTDLGVSEEMRLIGENRKGAVAAKLVPIVERLAAAERRYAELAAAAAVQPTVDEHRLATDVASRLQFLTVKHGVPMATAALYDAVADGAVGVVAALRPYLASVFEDQGSIYANDAGLARLIELCDRVLPGWENHVAMARLQELGAARFALARAARDAGALGALPREYQDLVGK